MAEATRLVPPARRCSAAPSALIRSGWARYDNCWYIYLLARGGLPDMTVSRHDRFEVLAESIPHIVWLSAPDGSTGYFNERGTGYTGLPRQTNYGWGWLQMFHRADAPMAKTA